MDVAGIKQGTKQGTKRKVGDISMTIGDAMAKFSEKFSPGRVMTKSDWDILKEEGLLPPDTEKTKQEATIIALAKLIDSGAINPDRFMESIELFKTMRSKKGGGRNHKQRGGKDCGKTDYAILAAMMAVLYWTGAVGAATGYVAAGAASYMPSVDVISEKMTLCWSYLTYLVPASFPSYQLSGAVNAVWETFFRKVGETLIIIAEAANLSLKMGFSTGAETIWNATIGWVKDHPLYVVGGIAARKANGWRIEAARLREIEAGGQAINPVSIKTVYDKIIDITGKGIGILCDLIEVMTGIISTGFDTFVQTPAKIAGAFGPIDGPIGVLRNEVAAANALPAAKDDAAKALRSRRRSVVEVQGRAPVDGNDGDTESGPDDGGGKRSTRKRAGRTRNAKSRKPKSRKPKKRKSSGRKAKKASRKIKSRKGRKTRRCGSKKR